MSTGLPAEVTSFVGRRRELAQARRLLSQARLLTLTGVAGVGKTRLALRVADGACHGFPDGVYLAELDALGDPGLLAQTVAGVFGLGDASTDPTRRLATYLADKRALLVLDNCEHLVESCAVFLDQLLTAVPGLRVLATSRHGLGVAGEQVLRVPPLPVPERIQEMGRSAAVSLFADRATAVNPEFVVDERSREQVLAICRRLEGVPLAIELAAAWAGTLTPEEILRRLDDRFALLAKGSRTAPPRQQTLAGALEWSYHLCAPAERRLWARLSVFTGDFDLTAAEQVCAGEDVERAGMLGLVAGLVDKSLLLPHRSSRCPHGRFRMLETIRQYGLNLLTASGEAEQVRNRHAEYYRRLTRGYAAESFGSGQIVWTQLLLAEHANIRAALEFALATPGTAGAASEIATAALNFWFASGFLREGYRWLERALAVDREPTSRRGHALWACAFAGAALGEADTASQMLVECAELAEKLDDSELRAGHALGAGYAALRQGKSPEAGALLEDAVAAYRELGDQEHLVASLNLLGMAKLFTEPERGAQASRQALELSQEHGATWFQSYTLYGVALHQWRVGEHRQAAALLRQAIRLRSGVPDWSALAYLVKALAWCAHSVGQRDRAARLFGAATAIWRLSGTGADERLPFQPVDNQIIEQTRGELGEDRFHAEFEKGRRFSVDQAISDALEEHRPSTADRDRQATPLTRRQTQIAELIAQGLTNKEIAARLTIAQRTAEGHVENLLTKLGFTSRAQVATWFAERRADTDEMR